MHHCRKIGLMFLSVKSTFLTYLDSYLGSNEWCFTAFRRYIAYNPTGTVYLRGILYYPYHKVTFITNYHH